MAPVSSGGYLVAEARQREGLSQAELARRLATSQSLVARWESGAVAPSFAAVVRAVRACGLELDVSLSPYDADHDVLISDQLGLTPEQRLDGMLDHLSVIERLQSNARIVDG